MRLCVLFEGKFPITKSMYDTAEKAAWHAKRLSDIYDPSSQVNRPSVYMGGGFNNAYKEIDSYRAVVDAGKYGKKDILIAFGEPKRGIQAQADIYNNSVIVYIYPEKQKDHYLDSILHELVHIFDPKLNDDELRSRLTRAEREVWKAKRGAKTGKDLAAVHMKYLKMPHEQDAHITTMANSLMRYLSRNKETIQGVKAFLRMLDSDLIYTFPEAFNNIYFLLNAGKNVKRKFLRAVQQAFNELEESGIMQDNPKAERKEKIDVYWHKPSGIPGIVFTIPKFKYQSKVFNSKEDARKYTKQVADALAKW